MNKLKNILFCLIAVIALPIIGIWMHIRHPKLMWETYKKEYKEKGILKMLFYSD